MVVPLLIVRLTAAREKKIVFFSKIYNIADLFVYLT